MYRQPWRPGFCLYLREVRGEVQGAQLLMFAAASQPASLPSFLPHFIPLSTFTLHSQGVLYSHTSTRQGVAWGDAWVGPAGSGLPLSLCPACRWLSCSVTCWLRYLCMGELQCACGRGLGTQSWSGVRPRWCGMGHASTSPAPWAGQTLYPSVPVL